MVTLLTQQTTAINQPINQLIIQPKHIFIVPGPCTDTVN